MKPTKGYSKKRRRKHTSEVTKPIVKPSVESFNRPKEETSKRSFSFVWLLLFFLYEELVLSIVTGSFPGNGSHLFVITLSSVTVGVCLLSILRILPTNRTRKGILGILCVLTAVVFTAFAILHRSFQVFLSPTSLFSGTKDAVENFQDRILYAIRGNIWLITLLILPAISMFLVSIPGYSKTKTWKNGCTFLLAICLVFSEFSYLQYDPRNQVAASVDYDFDTAVDRFGLQTSLVLDWVYQHSSRTNSFETVEVETAEPVQTISRNELPIDFEALQETGSSELASVDAFLATQKGSLQNEYTGLFEGMNLIQITAESFASGVIDEEITPTLYRLATKGIQFTDYYQPAWGGSTTTGEYSILMGLIPVNGVNSMKETATHNLFPTIGNQLRALDYFSRSYHNNEYTYYSRDLTHENIGYDQYLGMGNGLEEGVQWIWPASDDEMIQWTLPQYIEEEPFSIYYMTVSGHPAYVESRDAMAKKNLAYLEATFPKFNQYSEKVKCYLAANYELEKGLTYLIAQLEEKGIADRTVISLTSDHYPYGLEQSAAWENEINYIDELYGYPIGLYNQMIRDRNTWILWNESIEGDDIRVDQPCSSIDIVPTLSNLFGTKFDSRLYAGRDVFSESEAVVVWMNRSWKSSLGSYNSSTDVFTPAVGVEASSIPVNYVSRIQSIVRNKFTLSEAVLNLDYYAHVEGGIQ